MYFMSKLPIFITMSTIFMIVIRDLSYNEISGKIPKELGNLNLLRILLVFFLLKIEHRSIFVKFYLSFVIIQESI